MNETDEERKLVYDILFDAFDSAFWAGDFAAVDWFIAGLDPEDMSTLAVVSLLTHGWHARDKLNELVPFFLKAERTLLAREGERGARLLLNRDPREPRRMGWTT